ncbi:hypothetical protein [Caudoviricetes sp.]|nr:hypothetical protein [Caudoviricetes sp.]
MKISVTIKSVYGNEMIYPACPVAEAFAQLAGTKTLTRQALQIIKSMGYQIEVQTPAIAL